MDDDVMVRFERMSKSVRGSVVHPHGCAETPFVGWLELLAVLEEVVEGLRSREPPEG